MEYFSSSATPTTFQAPGSRRGWWLCCGTAQIWTLSSPQKGLSDGAALGPFICGSDRGRMLPHHILTPRLPLPSPRPSVPYRFLPQSFTRACTPISASASGEHNPRQLFISLYCTHRSKAGSYEVTEENVRFSL